GDDVEEGAAVRRALQRQGFGAKRKAGERLNGNRWSRGGRRDEARCCCKRGEQGSTQDSQLWIAAPRPKPLRKPVEHLLDGAHSPRYDSRSQLNGRAGSVSW